jgi:hypothetical protein
MTANIKTFHNPRGTISNSDLEMAGLLLLWLTMEGVCGNLREQRVTLFSNNSPTGGWVERLASKWSLVAKHLIQALALRIKIHQTCPLTSMHIEGQQNTIADIPLRSFGSHPVPGIVSQTQMYSLCSILCFPSQISNRGRLGWEIHSEFCRILRSIRFWTF